MLNIFHEYIIVGMFDMHVLVGHACGDEVGVCLYQNTFHGHQITDKKTFRSIDQHQRGRGTCFCGSRVRNSEDNPDTEVGGHCTTSRMQHVEVDGSCRTSHLFDQLVGPIQTTPVSGRHAVDIHPIPAKSLWQSGILSVVCAAMCQ
jgi:hypothetical protein